MVKCIPLLIIDGIGQKENKNKTLILCILIIEPFENLDKWNAVEKLLFYYYDFHVLQLNIDAILAIPHFPPSFKSQTSC